MRNEAAMNTEISTKINDERVRALLAELIIKHGEDHLFSESKWKDIALKLHIARLDIEKLDKKLMSGTTPTNAIFDLLEKWNMLCPDEASVETLMVILKELDLNAIVSGLKTDFYREHEIMLQNNSQVYTIPTQSRSYSNMPVISTGSNVKKVSQSKGTFTLPHCLSVCTTSKKCKMFILPAFLISFVLCMVTLGLVQFVNGNDTEKSIPNNVHVKHSHAGAGNVNLAIINCVEVNSTLAITNMLSDTLVQNGTLISLPNISKAQNIQIENFSVCAAYCDIFVGAFEIEKLVSVVIQNVTDAKSQTCLKNILQKHKSTLEVLDIKAAEDFIVTLLEDSRIYSKVWKLILRALDNHDDSQVFQMERSIFSGEKICETFPELVTVYYEHSINYTELLHTLTLCPVLKNLTTVVTINNLDWHFNLNLILGNRKFECIFLKFLFGKDCPKQEWYDEIDKLKGQCTEAKFNYSKCPGPDKSSPTKEKFQFHHKSGDLQDIPPES